MKRIAWMSAVGALLAAAPAMAQGHAGISYQNIDDADLDSIAISGSAMLGENVQVDGRYAFLDADGGGDGDAFALGGHLLQRGGGHFWGGYLGYQQVDDDGGFDVDEFTVALEGGLYVDRTTWSGAVSYTNADFIADVDQWAIDGEARHFLTDTFSLQGNVGLFTLDGGGGDEDGWTAGVGGEVQIEGTPFSVHAGYQHVDFDGDSAGSVGIGARMAFGGQSLFARNRSGAGLNRPVGVIDRLVGDLSPR